MKKSKDPKHQKITLILLFLCSIIIALAIVELITSEVLHYPHYTPGSRKFILSEKLGPYNVLAWRPPFYSFLSVEGNNHVYRYNNIGLPGSDLHLPLSDNNIFVLGSSFIEATTVKNTETATAQFQKLLAADGLSYNVFNLGSSGHDPYVMWFRAQFFKRYFTPKHIIVVIDPSSINYFADRWSDTLSFQLPPFFAKEIKQNTMLKYLSLPRKYSAFLNLIIQSHATRKNRQNDLPEQQIILSHSSEKEIWNKFDQSIEEFKKSFGEKIMVVSIIPDQSQNQRLRDICRANNCYFTCNESILKPENRFNGTGHLNTKGNKLLGEFLFTSYLNFLRLTCSKV